MVREWSVNWTKGTTQDTTRTTTGGPRNEEWFVSSFFHFHFLWLISCFRSSLLSSLHYKWAKWKEKEKETNHTSLLGLTVHSCSASFSSFFALFSLPSLTSFVQSIEKEQRKRRERKKEQTPKNTVMIWEVGGWRGEGKVRKERSEWRTLSVQQGTNTNPWSGSFLCSLCYCSSLHHSIVMKRSESTNGMWRRNRTNRTHQINLTLVM